MKRILSLAFVLVLALALVSCGGKKEDFTLDTAALVADIKAGDLFADTSLQPVREDTLSTIYGLSADLITAWDYYAGSMVTGEEFAVLTCKDEDAAKTVLAELTQHRDDLYSTYESYSPESLPRISGAVLAQKGVYAIFISAEHNDKAQAIVDGYLA